MSDLILWMVSLGEFCLSIFLVMMSFIFLFFCRVVVMLFVLVVVRCLKLRLNGYVVFFVFWGDVVVLIFGVW